MFHSSLPWPYAMPFNYNFHTMPSMEPIPGVEQNYSAYYFSRIHPMDRYADYSGPQNGGPFHTLPAYPTPRGNANGPSPRRHHSERKPRSSEYRDKGETSGVFDDESYRYRTCHSSSQAFNQQSQHTVGAASDHNQTPSSSARPNANRQRPGLATSQPPPATPMNASATEKGTGTATDDDARRAGIPAGYCCKHWDPSEEPIVLLGSVFDANSLGRWTYDWTVFCHGSATPLAEMAGELWLLLIQLAGKVKRAKEVMPEIRKVASRDLLEDFLESGERLWTRFAKLLKVCEGYMWKAAKNGNKGREIISVNGRDFVDSIFGRDRELEKTEKLMTGMRLWSMRFDANCDDVLRYPTT